MQLLMNNPHNHVLVSSVTPFVVGREEKSGKLNYLSHWVYSNISGKQYNKCLTSALWAKDRSDMFPHVNS